MCCGDAAQTLTGGTPVRTSKDTQAIAAPDHAQRMRRYLLVLAIVLPALFLGAILAAIVHDYRATIQEAETDAQHISTALREHADRSIGEADRLMQAAIADIESNELGATPADAAQLTTVLRRYANVLPQFLAINVIDAQGKVVASGLPLPAAPVNVQDRDYFQFHAQQGNGLYISRTVRSRTSGQWVFTLSRSLRHPDGSLKMVLAAGMSVTYFEHFYRSLDPGVHSRLFLVRQDGRVLVESPMTGKELDRDLSGAQLFTRFRNNPTGSYHLEHSPIDRTARIVGYTQSRDYPFLALSSLSEADVLTPWSTRMQHSLAWGLASAALMLVLIAMLRGQFSSLLAAHDTLQDKNQVLLRSERRYQELVGGIDGVVWEADYPSLRFTYVSQNAGRLTGYPPAEWLETPDFWEKHLHTDRKSVLQALAEQEPSDAAQPLRLEHHVVPPAGGDVWLLDNLSVSHLDGKVTLRGVMVDHTDRKRAYQELELAAKVFDSSLLGILIVARDGTILRANTAFSELIGYSVDHLVGAGVETFSSDFREPAVAEAVKTSLRTTGTWQGEARVERRTGETLILMNSMSLIRDDKGRPSAVVMIAKDITEQRASERQLYHMAHFDHLTQLPNRPALLDRLRHALVLAERQHTRLAVMFVDLDHFKAINDSLGHAVGDQVLRVAAERIQRHVRLSDTVARVGGDEFVLLLEDVDHATHAVRGIAQKLCTAMSEAIRVDGNELYIGLSIGVARYPDDGRDSDSLIRNADTAMYRAKMSGRNCWRFFDASMAESVSRRLDLGMALRQAVARDEMTLYYQPQRSLRTGEIIGVEALLRWQRPGMGTISPLEFIPISEESDSIVPLGNWVLRTACAQGARWLRERGRDRGLRVSVNITARQIRHDQFVDDVRQALEASGLPAELLELEITESSLLESIDDTVEKLNQLKRMGVTVAIDDFGTGYSSLSYLTQLPVDRLKIDQSLVRDTPRDKHYCAIVRTIIAMSGSLGLSVIAEGVESAEQSQFLEAEGCDEIQGFLLSPPQPAEALADIL